MSPELSQKIAKNQFFFLGSCAQMCTRAQKKKNQKQKKKNSSFRKFEKTIEQPIIVFLLFIIFFFVWRVFLIERGHSILGVSNFFFFFFGIFFSTAAAQPTNQPTDLIGQFSELLVSQGSDWATSALCTGDQKKKIVHWWPKCAPVHRILGWG